MRFGDVLSEAVLDYETLVPSGFIEAGNRSVVKDNSRRRCCSMCGSVNTLSEVIADDGKKMYSCSRCDHVSENVSYRMRNGPAVAQTRNANSSVVLVSEFGLSAGCSSRISGMARAWFVWSHTSEYRGDKVRAASALKNLLFSVYCQVAENINCRKSDDTEFMVRTLVKLIVYMLESCRFNSKPNYSEFARHSGLRACDFDRSKGYRWARIRDDILAVFARWDEEIVKSVENV